MRRFFAFVYCFSALAFAACDDNKGDSPEQWFRQPEVTVDGLTAEVTCLTLFGKGVLASNPCGFVCQPVSSASTAPAITVTDPRIEDSMLKCTLTSLAPETVYMVYPFVDMNGERMTGKPAVFQTWEAPEEPDPDNPGPDEPKPDPDPDPDPDNPDPDKPTPPPDPGATRHSGWAELLGEKENADYYYAYYMCANAPTVRNYTVCFSKELCGPIWVAYPMHKYYTNGDVGRNEEWQYGPIIPTSVQPSLKSAYKPINSYSRGHMLASNDRQSSVAINEQTYYFTNMSPQIQNGFNGGIWKDLELNCHKMICSDTLYMVTGAHFANRNTTCEDNSKPAKKVTVPTNFYKVLIRSKAGNTGKPLWELSADEIECAGYWFDHKSYSGVTPSQFIKSVEWIEQQTGQTFFPNVPQAPKGKLNTSFWKI